MKAYDEVPRESKPLLDSAVKVLATHSMDIREVVLMVYRLGFTDGRMEQLDRCEEQAMALMLPMAKESIN